DAWVAWGELGLDGSLKAAGQLTRLALAAWKAGARHIVVASDEAPALCERLSLLRDAGTAPGEAPEIVGAENLGEAWDKFRASRRGHRPIARPLPGAFPENASPEEARPPLLLPVQPAL